MQTDADPDLMHLSRVVRESVGRLNWRMRAEPDQNTPRSLPGLLALAVLSRLYRAGTHTPKALSEAERIQPQSLTRVLATLEERDWVKRVPDPADGRQSLITITPGGLAKLREYSVHREEWLATAMAEKLSPTERELLRLAADLMTRLADS
jgi:DNA-binding MarR family transcriptional regulator